MNLIPNLSIIVLFCCQLFITVTCSNLYSMSEPNLKEATFGGGCFWCIEAIFDELNGVVSAESGYSGGNFNNPTYKEICTGNTEHAEVIRIVYNADEISFDELLEVFWSIHDPTTLNRQGADIGTQYRSVIFYHNDIQKEKAEIYKHKLNESEIWPKPVVTEISSLINYFKAEEYHQEYYELNKKQAYCSFVITPKIDKLRKAFPSKLKK